MPFPPVWQVSEAAEVGGKTPWNFYKAWIFFQRLIKRFPTEIQDPGSWFWVSWPETFLVLRRFPTTQ